MSDKETGDRWSEGSQIFFTGGKGWGITGTLQNICLGKEDDIQKFFETGELNDELDPPETGIKRNSRL